MSMLCLILAVLSIWDYPARQPQHEKLSQQFIAAVREGDTATMEETCRKGVKLLPDDPTWRYNLACSLAYYAKRQNEALDELEKAIDLGFRDAEAIKKDTDLKRLMNLRRYDELIEYAKMMQTRPIMFGPMASVDATGIFGKSVSLGEQNLGWDFDFGCFVAHLKMAVASAGGNTGDLYMNRDKNHAPLDVANFPGLTAIGLDKTGRERGMDVAIPNMLFPYPIFGNSSQAFTQGPYWRSIPRMLTTVEAGRLKTMTKFYLSNQTWVFPANADIAPVGTNGDVFASITPYYLTTAGRSYSDLPYLRGALEASRAFTSEVKAALVRQGLLAPTIQTILRKSLKGVTNEVDYLSAKAHPTALPKGGLDVHRVAAQAKALTLQAIPPLAIVTVTTPKLAKPPIWPELLYASACAWSYVLRDKTTPVRTFTIKARGAKEYAFVQTHGAGINAKIERIGTDAAQVTLDTLALTPTNRVDITVVGRNPGTGWGAPSYVCFARMDAKAPYSDPVLTPLENPPTK